MKPILSSPIVYAINVTNKIEIINKNYLSKDIQKWRQILMHCNEQTSKQRSAIVYLCHPNRILS